MKTNVSFELVSRIHESNLTKIYVLSKNWCLKNLFDLDLWKKCHVIAELWQKFKLISLDKSGLPNCPYSRNAASLLKKEEKMKKNLSILFELGAQTFFWKWETHNKGKPLLPSCNSHTFNKVHTKYQTFLKVRFMAKCTWWENQVWKIQVQQTGFLTCKNQFRNWFFQATQAVKIQFEMD